MKAAILLLPLLAHAAIPDKMSIPVSAPGRVAADGRLGWPGGYFEGWFAGSDVTVRVEPNGEPLRLLVDGKLRATLADQTGFSVTDLAKGEHVVRLEKVTESQTGGPRFLGFFTTGSALRTRPGARQIEFIGDSLTVGYGNTSPARTCDGAKVRATTDTQLAFGPLAAKALGADYRVIAYSGYGMVRNYAGKFAGESLPFLYPRTVPGDPAVMPVERNWRPQAIVINLGTNDFSSALRLGEAWGSVDKLHAGYRAGYVAFLRLLKRAQPQAKLVLMSGPIFAADVAAIAPGEGATVLAMPALELTGCNWHPSLKDHRAMADLVEAAVKPLLDR